MKAEELMIGDWVQISEPCKYHGAIGHIKTLIDHKDNETAHFKVFFQSNTIHIGIENICSDDIKPIPLTSEILEKNGFTKSTPPPGIHARCYELDSKKDRYNLIISNYNKYKKLLLDVDSEDSECFNIKCDYVHELQHALRLCRIEKDIIL